MPVQHIGIGKDVHSSTGQMKELLQKSEIGELRNQYQSRRMIVQQREWVEFNNVHLPNPATSSLPLQPVHL